MNKGLPSVADGLNGFLDSQITYVNEVIAKIGCGGSTEISNFRDTLQQIKDQVATPLKASINSYTSSSQTELNKFSSTIYNALNSYYYVSDLTSEYLSQYQALEQQTTDIFNTA